MNSYELYHHGVLGMKWGVRRYQNPDGTLKEGARTKIKSTDYDTYVQNRLKGVKNKNEITKILREENRRISEDATSHATKEQKRVIAGNAVGISGYIGGLAALSAGIISGPVGGAVMGSSVVGMLANAGRSVISNMNTIERANKNVNVVGKYYDEYNITDETKRVVNL